jgi:hypothetical protein
MPSNYVHLKLNKPLDDNDLNILLIYFQNTKKSNGGYILKHKQDNINNTLSLFFETKDAKYGVLYRKIHKVLDYLLVPSEFIKFKNDLSKIQFNMRKCLKILVLSNIDSNEDVSTVRRYIEYLVPGNDIIQMKLSSIFLNTFIIEFKKEVSYKKVKNRYLQNSILNKNVIKVYEAYDSYTVFIKNPFEVEHLNTEAYFVYIDYLNAYLVCNHDGILSKSIEKLYNLDQISDILSENSIEDDTLKKQDQIVTPLPANKIDFDCLIKSFEITIESFFFIKFLKCPQIFKDFNKNLNKINANLCQINDNSFKIVYKNGEIKVKEHEKWLQLVKNEIYEFQKYLSFNQITLPSQNMRNILEQNINSLYLLNPNEVHIYFNDPFICIIGYEDSVEYSYKTILLMLQPSVPQTLQEPVIAVKPKKVAKKRVKPIQAINSESLITEDPSFRIDNILFESLLIECKKIYDDLNMFIKSSNAQLRTVNNDIIIVTPIKYPSNKQKDELFAKVNTVINSFYEHQISVIKIDEKYFDINLIKKFKQEIATEKTKHFIYKIYSPNEVSICGSKKSVNRIVSFLRESKKLPKKKQQNQPQRCKVQKKGSTKNDFEILFKKEETLLTKNTWNGVLYSTIVKINTLPVKHKQKISNQTSMSVKPVKRKPSCKQKNLKNCPPNQQRPQLSSLNLQMPPIPLDLPILFIEHFRKNSQCIVKNSLFCSLILNCQKIRDELNENIKGLNSKLHTVRNDEIIVSQIESSKIKNNGSRKYYVHVENELRTWFEKVSKAIDKFYRNQITVSKVDAKYFDEYSINKYKSVIAPKKKRNFVYKFDKTTKEFIVCGYIRSVKSVVFFLTGMLFEPKLKEELPLKSEIKTKVEFTFNIENSLLNSLLFGCEKIYDDLNACIKEFGAKLSFGDNRTIIVVAKLENVANKVKVFGKVNERISKFYLHQISNLTLDIKYFNHNLINIMYNSEISTESTRNFIYQINRQNKIVICGDKKSIERIKSYLMVADESKEHHCTLKYTVAFGDYIKQAFSNKANKNGLIRKANEITEMMENLKLNKKLQLKLNIKVFFNIFQRFFNLNVNLVRLLKSKTLLNLLTKHMCLNSDLNGIFYISFFL